MTPEQLQLQIAQWNVLAVIGSAVVAALAALGGVLITQRNQATTRESEERRWYAQQFLPREVDALSNLYAAAVEAANAFLSYSNAPGIQLITLKEEMEPKHQAFRRAKALAYVYLDSGGKQVVSNLDAAIAQVEIFLTFNVPGATFPDIQDAARKSGQIPPPDWNRLEETAQAAYSYFESVLKTKVPDSIKRAKA